MQSSQGLLDVPYFFPALGSDLRNAPLAYKPKRLALTKPPEKTYARIFVVRCEAKLKKQTD
jgi:hypothetical protein